MSTITEPLDGADETESRPRSTTPTRGAHGPTDAIPATPSTPPAARRRASPSHRTPGERNASAPSTSRLRSLVVVIVAAAIAALATALLLIATDGTPSRTEPTVPDRQTILRDLVERGQIPPQSLQPLTHPADTDRTDHIDRAIRDLVERAQIAPQSLEPLPDTVVSDHTDHTDRAIRDLVERAQIPPQSLEPLTHPADTDHTDRAIRDLVERAQIPPQSLEP